MVHNPITEEIREIRHRLAARFNNDVYRIGAEIRRRQAESNRRIVRRQRRQPAPMTTTNRVARGVSAPGPHTTEHAGPH